MILNLNFSYVFIIIIYSSFKLIQIFTINNLPWQLIPITHHPSSKRKFSNIKSISGFNKFEVCSLVTPSFTNLKNVSLFKFSLPEIILKVSNISPRNLRVSEVVNPRYFSLSSYGKSLQFLTNLVALLWTPSILTFFLVYEFHARIAYSRCGLTNPLYSLTNISLSKYEKFLLTVPSIWFPFLAYGPSNSQTQGDL